MNYTWLALPLVPSTITKRIWRAVISIKEEPGNDAIIEYIAILGHGTFKSDEKKNKRCHYHEQTDLKRGHRINFRAELDQVEW
jgi:hypothetical protein